MRDHGSRITHHSSLLHPKPSAASHSKIIRDELHIRIELELDMFCVSASDVQLVEVSKHPQRLDSLLDAFVPFLLADFFHRLVAKLLVIRLVFAKRKMSDFQMRRKLTIHKQRRTKTCPKGNDHLNAFAFDRSVALHVGIVDNSDRLTKALLERASQIESFQFFRPKVRRSDDLPSAHDSGETDRNIIVVQERGDQLDQYVNQ